MDNEKVRHLMITSNVEHKDIPVCEDNNYNGEIVVNV